MKRNERLQQKVAHAESYISDKMKTPPVHRVMISHATLAAFLRYEGRNIQILHGTRPRPVSKDENGSDCKMMPKRY